MEENLVIHAIQCKSLKKIRERYKLFDSEEERDKEFDFMRGNSTPSIRRVTLIIQVDDASSARLF